jgi:hypothetical protein
MATTLLRTHHYREPLALRSHLYARDCLLGYSRERLPLGVLRRQRMPAAHRVCWSEFAMQAYAAAHALAPRPVLGPLPFHRSGSYMTGVNAYTALLDPISLRVPSLGQQRPESEYSFSQ